MSVKNKQNSSVNFLVRAEFLTARPLDRPAATAIHNFNRLKIYVIALAVDHGFRNNSIDWQIRIYTFSARRAAILNFRLAVQIMLVYCKPSQ